MFDIVGVASLRVPLETPLLGHGLGPFGSEPWASLASQTIQDIRTEYWQVKTLSRPGIADVAVSAHRQLFLAGEAFARWDARGRDGVGRGILSADALLHAYERLGGGITSLIKGDFVLIILDAGSLEHRIITSRFAISPLYYAFMRGRLYFSTCLGSLAHILPELPKIDQAAVLETALFNFPMGRRTFLEGLQRAEQGAMTTISERGVKVEPYWEHARFYDARPLPAHDALEIGSDLFFRSVNALAEDTPRICASFTSGFDSRALHAVLRKKRADVLAYAFGAKGSINVTIPERICARMGYPFRPIHLDEQFERHFSRFAWRTIILSDGLVVQRANYPYAFEQLGRFAPVVLTGLFGSEFLRTFQNLGTVVSEHFAVVNDAGGSEAAIARVVREAKNASYLAPHVFRQAGDEVIADLGRWFRRFEHLERDHRLYMYLLTEVDRKYFAAELSTERIYATNRLPFLDDEFVEFVFSAPFAGVYARTITPTIGNRFSSQYFYAYLIRKYCPQLLPFTTDHGFPPAHLLRPLPILWVGAGYAQSRLQRRVRPNVEFRPRRWLQAFYTQEHGRLLCDVGIAGPKFAQDLQSGAYLDNLANFDKVAALHLWLGHLDGTVA